MIKVTTHIKHKITKLHRQFKLQFIFPLFFLRPNNRKERERVEEKKNLCDKFYYNFSLRRESSTPIVIFITPMPKQKKTNSQNFIQKKKYVWLNSKSYINNYKNMESCIFFLFISVYLIKWDQLVPILFYGVRKRSQKFKNHRKKMS